MVSKRRVLIVAAVVALIVAPLSMPLLLRQIPFFDVRRVEVVGANFLTTDRVLDALEMPDRYSVFNGFGELEERLESVPGILRVRIDRVLPATLRIAISERPPVAMVQGPNGLVVLGPEARPLPYDPTEVEIDVPLVERADRTLVEIVSSVRDNSQRLFAELVGVRAESEGHHTLEFEDQRVLVEGPLTPQRVREIAAVRGHLDRSGRHFRELDGRYDGWIVAREEGV